MNAPNSSKKAPLLVFALEQESQNLFIGYNVLYTGVGKVNASYALMNHLQNNEAPSHIVNLGTAGSRAHKPGTVINATSFVQRDMDVRALGFEQFQTPFSPDPAKLEYGLKLDKIEHGTCGTGDNFDTGEHALLFDVVDMEAYALALIAQRQSIPFLCLKYISDGANDDANHDWNEALERAAKALKETFEDIKL